MHQIRPVGRLLRQSRTAAAIFFWAAQLSAQSLHAVSASKSQVDLAWSGTASAYTVERKVAGPGQFASIGQSSSPTFSDKSVDAFTTYVYRVRGSGPSNEITVGPPPVGVSVASPYRAELKVREQSDFGRRPFAVLDANGDPAIVYYTLVTDDPRVGSFLEFVSWNRAEYRWNVPVRVGVIGEAESTGSGVTLASMARDASDNTWVIATIFVPTESEAKRAVRLYTSRDNGKTWTAALTIRDAENQIVHPSVAVDKGVVHLVYSADRKGLRYATGKLTDPFERWTDTQIPMPASAAEYRDIGKVRLDAAGDPVIAYFGVAENDSYILACWRPKSKALTKVIESGQRQNDFLEVELQMQGSLARIATRLIQDDVGAEGYDHQIWVAAEQAGGGFPLLTGLPADGNTTMGYISFALGSAGQAAVVADRIGGNEGGVKCNNPKLMRSADLIKWSSCGLYGSSPTPYVNAQWPQVLFGGNDRMYVVMTDTQAESKTSGVVVWRE